MIGKKNGAANTLHALSFMGCALTARFGNSSLSATASIHSRLLITVARLGKRGRPRPSSRQVTLCLCIPLAAAASR